MSKRCWASAKCKNEFSNSCITVFMSVQNLMQRERKLKINSYNYYHLRAKIQCGIGCFKETSCTFRWWPHRFVQATALPWMPSDAWSRRTALSSPWPQLPHWLLQPQSFQVLQARPHWRPSRPDAPEADQAFPNAGWTIKDIGINLCFLKKWYGWSILIPLNSTPPEPCLQIASIDPAGSSWPSPCQRSAQSTPPHCCHICTSLKDGIDKLYVISLTWKNKYPSIFRGSWAPVF